MADELDRLAAQAESEAGFTRLSLDNLGSADVIRTQLQVALEKSLRGHEGVKGLETRIRSVMGENLARAKTIARTERTRTLSGNRIAEAIRDYQQGKEEEIPLFQWINPRTAKEPRHEHVAISGKILPAGQEFLPGLRYPGDPNAPPSQTINCHCYIRRVRRSR